MANATVEILLIEDNAGDADLLMRQLAEAGGAAFHLECADRLAAGIERAEAASFDLALLDLTLPESRGLDTLARFRAQLPSLPIIVLTGQEDEAAALEAVSQGAQEYLVKGRVNGPALVRCIRYAIERHRAMAERLRSSAPAKSGRVFAFVGAKGGVGATTVVLNVAASLASRQATAVAAELDGFTGALATHLRHSPRRHLGNLLRRSRPGIAPADVASQLVSFPFGVQVLFGPQAPQHVGAADPEQVAAAISAIKRLADYVLVDAPIYAGSTVPVVRNCDSVVLVTDRDPCSVLSARQTFDLLKSWGVHPSQAGLVVNNRTALMSSQSLAEIASEVGCHVLGVIPNGSDAFTQSHRKGQPLVVFHPESPAAQSIAELARRLSQVTLEAIAV